MQTNAIFNKKIGKILTKKNLIMSQVKFGARTTALEVVEGHDLNGYEIIVTGAASGIGVETVRAFAKAGARCIIGARDMTKAEQVADEIRKDTRNEKVEVEKIELDSLESVNNFVERFLSKKRPLHILVNNAGIMACPLSYTKDGFENQFGTNHMGHFALTLGLMPALIEAYKLTGRKSRVVSLSSVGHAFADINFDDINFKTRPYDKWIAYGQSKTANTLFSIGLTHHYSDKGVVSNSLMPGAIYTNLHRHMPQEEVKGLNIDDKIIKTVAQGASTSVWAAISPELNDKGGLYLENCGIAEPKETMTECLATSAGYLKHAYNKENALRLWNISLGWLENPPAKA